VERRRVNLDDVRDRERCRGPCELVCRARRSAAC